MKYLDDSGIIALYNDVNLKWIGYSFLGLKNNILSYVKNIFWTRQNKIAHVHLNKKGSVTHIYKKF